MCHSDLCPGAWERTSQEFDTISYSRISPWKTCTTPFPQSGKEGAVLDRGTVINRVFLLSKTCQRLVGKPLEEKAARRAASLCCCGCPFHAAPLVCGHHSWHQALAASTGWGSNRAAQSGCVGKYWNHGRLSSTSQPGWSAGSSRRAHVLLCWIPLFSSMSLCASKRIQSRNKSNYSNFAKDIDFSVCVSLSVSWCLSVYFLTVRVS